MSPRSLVPVMALFLLVVWVLYIRVVAVHAWRSVSLFNDSTASSAQADDVMETEIPDFGEVFNRSCSTRYLGGNSPACESEDMNYCVLAGEMGPICVYPRDLESAVPCADIDPSLGEGDYCRTGYVCVRTAPGEELLCVNITF